MPAWLTLPSIAIYQHAEPRARTAWLLLRKAIEEPDEGYLVGKSKPIMRAPALAKLREIFLGQAGGALELVAGKHLPV
jgi:hypothetical protein